ncbi:MAG: hypothetical protein Aurels2KO_50460 [Aureliella sp.]
MRIIMKSSVPTAALLFIFLIQAADAALVVSMVGEIQEGNLNGTNLAGSVFSYEAIVTRTTDLEASRNDLGTFAVAQATFDFGAAGQYSLGAEPSYFYWGLTGGAFYSGIALSVDVQAQRYDNVLQWLDSSTDLNAFEPNTLRPFDPFSDFDSASTFGSGGVAGPFSGTNALGDTLVISRMSNTGILAVTAVPEPSTLAVMLGLLPVAMVRRRHTCA